MYDIWGKYAAQGRYDEFNTTQVKLKLNNKTDSDIIKWINSKRNNRETSVQGAIKALIRADISNKE